MSIGNPITLTNNVASKSISATATADQTLFTVTGGYRINQLAVFRNGVRLADGADFTARDGSSVTLLTPANLGDNLEFQVFDDFRVADAIVSAEASQTINGDLTVTGNLLGASIGIGTASTNLGFNGFSYLGAPFGSTVNFAVTVSAKTAAHRYNGTGSSNGYVIDGVESPFLTLTPGRTYRFTLSSGDMTSHPFRFYLEADKTTAYTTNVTSTATYTEIVVTDSTPQVLHYQCSAHGYMGNSVQTNSNIASVATNATTATTATTATNAQGLTGTPDIAVRNITGVAATFTGVLTYEDVTNIDSIGIITARSGVKVPDSQKIFLGTGDDLQIYHDGTNTRFYNGTGNLVFRSSTYNFNNAAGTENCLDITENGSVELYYDNSKKLETTSSGVKFTGHLRGDDNNRLQLGDNQDLQIWNLGDNSYIRNGVGTLYIDAQTAGDDVFITNNSQSHHMAKFLGAGAVELYHNNSKKLETTSSGVTVSGGTLTSNGITQYALPTMGNGGQLGWDDGTKSLRLYANSSTDADAKIQFHFNESGTASMTFAQDGTISDSLGPVRRVKVDPASTGFTLTAAYAGQLIRQSGSGQTIHFPNGVFSAGDMVSFFNVGTGTLTITAAGTMYNTADAATGNRTIAAKGMATVICTASNEFAISGTQLT